MEKTTGFSSTMLSISSLYHSPQNGIFGDNWIQITKLNRLFLRHLSKVSRNLFNQQTTAET